MATVTIKQGDTLGALAQQYGTTLEGLQKLNTNITDPNVIQAGTNLNVPQAPANSTSVGTVNVEDLSGTKLSIPEQPKFDLTGTLTELDTFSKAKEATPEDIIATPEVQAQQTQLNEINSQIRLANVRALENQEKALATGETRSFAAGEAQRVVRNETFEAMRLAAVAETIQGNLSLAETRAERALDIKYKTQQDNLAATRRLLIANYDNLTPAQQKQVDQRLLEINEKDSFVAQKRAEDSSILSVAMEAAKNGADTATINKINSARSMEEAINFAGSSLQDPAAKLNLALKGMELKKTALELNLLQKYGGLSPSEYRAAQKEETERIKTATTASEQARLQGIALQEKISVIDAALNSAGFKSAVGTNVVARTGLGKTVSVGTGAAAGAAAGTVVAPVVGTIIGGLVGAGAGLFAGSPEELTGSHQNFIGSVEQMISKEFLQSLIDVKAQGATFGALQKAEQDALTQSASKIGFWRITQGKGDDKKVVGYNASEADFKAELVRIQGLARVAYERSTGKSWTDDENEVWDALEVGQSQFNPSF